MMDKMMQITIDKKIQADKEWKDKYGTLDFRYFLLGLISMVLIAISPLYSLYKWIAEYGKNFWIEGLSKEDFEDV